MAKQNTKFVEIRFFEFYGKHKEKLEFLNDNPIFLNRLKQINKHMNTNKY